jgi:DNA-directed RNA polymerase specialized sigma24 family protein
MDGDRHGFPAHPDGPMPDGPILDPREARARHRSRTSPSAGLVYLRALSATERRWLRGMVAGVARTYRVDRDDLMQDLQLSLLECDTIQHGRREVRAWLRRRAQWKAADLLRRHRTGPTRSTLPDEVLPDLATAEHAGPDRDWNVERLAAFKLSRDEAQVVLLTCWGFDVSLRDFAELVERSYAKTRQDKVRGLRKIEDLFDLEPEERAAFIAYREFGTHAAAAVRLGLPEDQLRAVVRRAENKINCTLGNAPDADRDRGDSSDVH